MKMKSFSIEKGKYGKRVVALTSAISDEMLKVLRRNDIKELELNDGKGWRGKNIDFIKEFSNLVAFEILRFTINDVSPVHYLHNLRRLHIDTYCKTPIDFSSFPSLEDIAMEWRPKCESLFNCRSLKRVFINHYVGKEKNLSPFSNLKNLEHLHVATPRINSIGDLSGVNKLNFLGISYASKLKSLAGIEVLNKSLRAIDLQWCKAFKKIDEIGKLTNLEVLNLGFCREIESLAPLKSLKKLKVFHFYDSTNILDGDLTVLKKLPNLREVSFQDRKHYNLKYEDFHQE